MKRPFFNVMANIFFHYGIGSDPIPNPALDCMFSMSGKPKDLTKEQLATGFKAYCQACKEKAENTVALSSGTLPNEAFKTVGEAFLPAFGRGAVTSKKYLTMAAEQNSPLRAILVLLGPAIDGMGAIDVPILCPGKLFLGAYSVSLS